MPDTANLHDALDAYFERQLLPPDAALEGAGRRSAEAGLVPHAVSPLQGAFLHILARAISARRILEIGTLGGYSSIWLDRALPTDGKLVSLEIDPHHRDVALRNIAEAGLSDRVEVRLGPAGDSLAAMIASGEPAFDLVFIDADKRSNPLYWDRALQLSRTGTLIVVDNVVRGGAILDERPADPDVEGVQAVFDRMAGEGRVMATTLQTVGTKGHDGFAIALVD